MMIVAILISSTVAVFMGAYYISTILVRSKALAKKSFIKTSSAEKESFFESKGLYGRILNELRICSLQSHPLAKSRVPDFVEERLLRKLYYAGIDRCSSLACFNKLLIQKLAQGALAGALIGALVSLEWALLLAVCGSLFSLVLINKALAQEMYLRKLTIQQELPEFLEVLSLGFGAGLNFDAALDLYLNHFSTRLSSDLARAQKLWDMGIKTRIEALQDLSDSYDFQLLERSFDTINASLKDGTSLVESLLSLTKQARLEVKVALEERIAKLPIKIMIPTGTLILPAMLLMVTGPVIVEFLETL